MTITRKTAPAVACNGLFPIDFGRMSLFGAFMLGLSAAPPSLADSKDNDRSTRNYFVEARSYRTQPYGDPPTYSRNLSKTGIAAVKDNDWLDVGLDFRMRYEYRENDFRRPANADADEPILLRTRAFLGVKNILDPFRFALEFEDARLYNSDFVRTDSEVNEFELIQGFAELYFENALGTKRPLRVRAGRQALELVDKRLIANNQFRNTTNNFEGFRVTLGQQTNDWDLDLLAYKPVQRLKYDFDEPIEQQWLYGAVAGWRRWSPFVTLQPYYLGYKVDNKNGATNQNIHSTALRGYGLIGDTGFDYDFDVVYQFGRSNGNQQHDAWASVVEVGYTFAGSPWKPRISALYGYGTGDRNPNDKVNNRFNSLFGFNQPWSRNDYFSWDNVSAPKLRLEFTPYKGVRIDTAYNAYWLASDRDSWRRVNLRDSTGRSGDFLGHEFDIRVRYRPIPRVETELSYARFTPGEFPKNLGKTLPSNFFYFQVSLNAFE